MSLRPLAVGVGVWQCRTQTPTAGRHSRLPHAFRLSASRRPTTCRFRGGEATVAHAVGARWNRQPCRQLPCGRREHHAGTAEQRANRSPFLLLLVLRSHQLAVLEPHDLQLIAPISSVFTMRWAPFRRCRRRQRRSLSSRSTSTSHTTARPRPLPWTDLPKYPVFGMLNAATKGSVASRLFLSSSPLPHHPTASPTPSDLPAPASNAVQHSHLLLLDSNLRRAAAAVAVPGRPPLERLEQGAQEGGHAPPGPPAQSVEAAHGQG
ncbi:hypothetical protein AAT19DRAFT_14492 [Rhodotorula toruloides]|uniref:Uncharacterized protein n=1 Tax=Rhodotorula toruloides TaxID=5286 RepID=A0A2T0A826_RHOTO|nr:hypothetical protein AAT19DRAFT_14492 [Rhodotorula toruloides]